MVARSNASRRVESTSAGGRRPRLRTLDSGRHARTCRKERHIGDTAVRHNGPTNESYTTAAAAPWPRPPVGQSIALHLHLQPCSYMRGADTPPQQIITRNPPPQRSLVITRTSTLTPQCAVWCIHLLSSCPPPPTRRRGMPPNTARRPALSMGAALRMRGCSSHRTHPAQAPGHRYAAQRIGIRRHTPLVHSLSLRSRLHPAAAIAIVIGCPAWPCSNARYAAADTVS